MKEVFWVGSSLSDLKEFPEDVQQRIGYTLQRVQEGKFSKKIKKLKGIRRGYNIYQIKSNHNRETYRAVYLDNLGDLIYVLHCFHKKSSFRTKTPPERRKFDSYTLKSSDRTCTSGRRKWFEEKIEVQKGSGNIFKDLEISNPEEYLKKARLVFTIEDLITESGLGLKEVAKILDISPTKLSTLLDGLLDNFSVDDLSSLITTLKSLTVDSAPRPNDRFFQRFRQVVYSLIRR